MSDTTDTTTGSGTRRLLTNATGQRMAYALEVLAAIPALQRRHLAVEEVGSGDTVLGLYEDAGLSRRIASDRVFSCSDGIADVLVANGVGAVYAKMGTAKAVAFATASDEELMSMCAAADQGVLNLADTWAVGDTRTVHIAGRSDGAGEQDVAIVLADASGYALSEATPGGRTSAEFIWTSVECLNESHAMNSSNTNTGGWACCGMRGWLNGIVLQQLPEWLRTCTKRVKVVSDMGYNTTGTATTADRLFLPAEYEVTGTAGSGMATANSSLHQWQRYKTAANRVKLNAIGSAGRWWRRSSISGDRISFCAGGPDGASTAAGASDSCGVSFCGCL